MIVRLTEGQLAACRQVAAPLAVPLADQLERGTLRGPSTQAPLDPQRSALRVDVNLPHVAWVALREALLDHCFTAKGYRTKGVSQRFTKALQGIAQAVNWWESLPALRGVGMVGHQAFAVPAWDASWLNVGQPWLPFPVFGRPMTLLRPVWTKQNGTRMTMWSAVEGLAPDDDWVTREDAFRGYEDVAKRLLVLAVRPS